jgi:hypothetical protein
LQPISASPPQPGQTYTLQVYDPVAKAFVTGTSKPLRILQKLVDQQEDLNSSAIALQSQFLKGNLTTLFGWREDIDKAYTSNTPTLLPTGGVDESKVAFGPGIKQGERSWTKSVVGKVPYTFPGQTEVRVFWNQSGNFNPVGQRRNLYNEVLGSPTAETEEKGISFDAFHGKFFLRVNRYVTSIQNDSVSVGNPYNFVSGQISKMLSARDAGLSPADFNYAGFSSFSDVAQALYTTIPARLLANVGPDKNFNPHFTGSGSTLQWVPDSVVGLTSTGNTVSRGTEYEAIMNPTRSWRISLSVVKNDAVKSDVAASELAYIAAWKQNLDTMYGGRLLPGAYDPVGANLQTFYDRYSLETLPAIRTVAALNGVASPEIRKWRVNLVTRYEFSQGFLKGVNIGGAVRWQDKVGIGYPYVTTAGVTAADITKPYYGPRETAVDLSAGYTRKFKAAGVPLTWSLGLNVSNVNAKDRLIPIAANSDGSWGTFRLPADRRWSVTNAFSF